MATDTLTNAEIDALAGRELELAVTRALGWKVREIKKRNLDYVTFEVTNAKGTHFRSGQFTSQCEAETAIINHVADNTDAALALLRETGQPHRMRWLNDWEPGEHPYEFTISPGAGPTGRGQTLAEAALRCWLKWKAAQE